MGKSKRKHARGRLIGACLPALAILAILAFGFFVRAGANRLPGIEPEERAYFQDRDGTPYLLEMDSYFYLRKATEMAETDAVIPSVLRSEDPLMGQRGSGASQDTPLPLGLSALAWLAWKYLTSAFGASLTQTARWMGPVLGSLAAIPAFAYVRRRSTLVGGIVAGLLVGCAIPFVSHTRAGFFDTDMVLAALPLTQLLAHMRAMQETRPGRQLGFAALSATALTVMSMFWVAYYAYFLFGIACTIVTVLLAAIVPSKCLGERPGHRRLLMLRGGSLALLISIGLLLLAHGWQAVRQLAHALASYRAAMNSVDAMPYAFRFTSEMLPPDKLPGFSPIEWMKANTKSLLGRLGGLAPCALAGIAIPAGLLRLLAVRSEERRNTHGPDARARKTYRWRGRLDGLLNALVPASSVPDIVVEAGFLFPWLLGAVLLAFRAGRLAEVASMPVALLCGLLVGRLFAAAGRLEARRGLAMTLCAIVAAGSVAPMCYGAWKNGRSGASTVNDAKCAAMTFIRDQLPDDTSIAAWWDDGYYMEYQAQRRTLLDGGSDSGKLNWLMANALLTDDPSVTANILRMMNECGADALDDLVAQGLDQPGAARLLLRLMHLDRVEAGKVLRDMDIDGALLDRTHPEASDPLLLALSTDMLSKHRALAYFGWWNPDEKAQEAEAFATASASSVPLENGQSGEIAMLDKAYTLYLSADQDGALSGEYADDGERRKLSRIVVWEAGNRIQDDALDGDGCAAVIVREAGRYSALLCSENLCDSMLVRMMACEDAGIAAADRLDTWYTDAGEEICAAQRRIQYDDPAAWCVQLWRIRD